jgi:hypothetical protein
MPSLAIAALPGLRPAAALALRLQGHPCPLPPSRASARRPPWLYGCRGIHAPCSLPGPPPGGRTGFTAAGASMPPAAFPGLRPAAAPPGGRARARSGAPRSFRRISSVSACPWPTVGRLGVARAMEPALLAERRQDAEARPASSERKAGCLERASGDTGTGSPELASPTSVRHPRASGTHDERLAWRDSARGVAAPRVGWQRAANSAGIPGSFRQAGIPP